MYKLRVDLLVLLYSSAALSFASEPARTVVPAPTPPVASSPTPPPAHATAAPDDEPHYPDLQVLLVMNWSYPGAEAELRKLEDVGGVFEKLRNQGWTVGIAPDDQLRIVSDDQVRELVDKLQLQVFPAVIALHDGQVIRSFRSGCTTPLDEYTFRWMRTGVSERPANVPTEPVQVAWSGSYPLRGAHWSVEGTYSPSQQQVIRHLRGGNHNYLIPSDWSIEHWSYEELRSLHDDLHEMHRPRSLVQHSPAAVTAPTVRPSTTPRTIIRYQGTFQSP